MLRLIIFHPASQQLDGINGELSQDEFYDFFYTDSVAALNLFQQEAQTDKLLNTECAYIGLSLSLSQQKGQNE